MENDTKKHLATEVQVAYFKGRWEATANNFLELLDPLLIPSLEAIGNHPDMAPVWSCQGHLDRQKAVRNGYIMIATSNDTILDLLLEKLFELSLESENKMMARHVHQWRLSSTYRKFQFVDPEKGESEWWKAKIISWTIPKPTEPIDWIVVLEKAIQLVIVKGE